FHFYPEMAACLLFALAAYPAGIFLPVEWGYETGPLENLQLLLSFIGIVFCWRVRRHKAAFRFFSFLLFLMMLRETNFGKTLFYPDPEHPNEFLRWDEIPYAPYVDPFIIVFLLFMAVYFFRCRLHLFLADFLRAGRIPVLNVAILVLSLTASLIMDKACDNDIAEEMVELAFYTGLIFSLFRAASPSCLWLPPSAQCAVPDRDR
ncbi:MAG: hypothetical protein IJU70_05130, partial [Lentisphaeria bacterium]|nr:hypothetical protein [Lentisphaeria bacterium]